MVREPTDSGDRGDGDDTDAVMAAMDGDGPCSRLVIADVSCDDAWVSVTATQAAALTDWQ